MAAALLAGVSDFEFRPSDSEWRVSPGAIIDWTAAGG
jgi:hypothetical protein